MDVSGHQLDLILLHIWQEIPLAPTPTIFSTELKMHDLNPNMWKKGQLHELFCFVLYRIAPVLRIFLFHFQLCLGINTNK